MADQQGPTKQELLAQRMDGIQREFNSLEPRAQLTSLYEDVGDIDQMLIDLPIELKDVRSRGYVHNRQLKDMLETLDGEWRKARPRIERMLKAQINQLETPLNNAQSQVQKMRTKTESSANAAETAVNSLESRIESAETSIKSQYDGVETQLNTISWQLEQVTEMMDWIDSSDEITLREAEGPLAAVEAEWHADGKNEGPDGILILTDQRLLFEQREEIVTKKKFGLFKSESKEIQKLHLQIETADIDDVSHKEEGGFLGMGKKDILELVLSASAPVSRARFHLKGEESSDWAEMVKLVTSREIDKDRADKYVKDVEIADETASAFPETCPNCYAQVPPPPRGIVKVECEFCGAIIMPMVSE